MGVLDRLRNRAAAGAGAVSADGAGSCFGEVSARMRAAPPGRKRLRSKTTVNGSSSSSATTNEQSAKCQKGEGQRVLRRIAIISAADFSQATTPNLAASQGVSRVKKSAAKGQAHLDDNDDDEDDDDDDEAAIDF